MHLKIEMIKLNANISRRALVHQIWDSSDKVVSPPVSVDNIVSVASSPGLSSINESWDSGGFTFQQGLYIQDGKSAGTAIFDQTKP